MHDQEYDFVCPAPDRYPLQWFWDSCFHAVVLSRLDLERAAAEIRTLLANQRADGFISHLTVWRREDGAQAIDESLVDWYAPGLSNSMQPPVLAEAVAAVAHRGMGIGFLTEVLPAVRAYYDWCDRVRDPDRDGLIVVWEPHETGMDQSPAFDAYLGVDEPSRATLDAARRRLSPARRGVPGGDTQGKFVVVDPLVNTLYAENQRVLADLLDEGGDSAGGSEVRARAARTAAALFTECWDPEAREFRGSAGASRRVLPGGTVAGLLPILLHGAPEGAVTAITDRLIDPAQFAARFPVPSVARSHPAYRPEPVDDLLWRGSTWICINWYLARGLRRHGRADLADQIESASLGLVERSGFREHYNPEIGTGYGARDFAWSALVLEMLAGRLEGDRIE